MTDQTPERSFDELTRELASGSLSRGKALRMMGAALVGAVSLGLLGGVAQAQELPGCRRNCNQEYGECLDASGGATPTLCQEQSRRCHARCDDAPAPRDCTRNGEFCRRDNQCCSGTCSSRDTCVGGAPGSGPGGCVQPSESCTTDQDCCRAGGLVGCRSGRCCRFLGQGCTRPSDCCSGNCINGGCTIH